MRAAHVAEGLVALEVARERDRVGYLAATNQRLRGAVYPTVNRQAEMLVAPESRDAVQRLVAQHDRAEQRLLGLDARRQLAQAALGQFGYDT